MNNVLTGRRVIYSDAEAITDANVITELQKAYKTHLKNREEIDYLYKYYKGNQPILNRVKEVRPEICSKIVENRAYEIVTFKSSYLVGEPVQYVSRTDDDEIANRITKLNDYMLSEDKETADQELEDWCHICGTAYRMVLPDETAGVDKDESPFEIYTPDPKNTFVVYQNSLSNQPMMGVTYTIRKDTNKNNIMCFSVYTDTMYYLIETTSPLSAWQITSREPQILGIPIIEYPLNNARMGAFEMVLPLLDAINLTESDRVDGVEQFIQSLLKFHNVDIDTKDFEKLKAMGAIKYKDIDPQTKGEIEYLTAELNQGETQVLMDHMYETVLTICGMPNRNGGSSTSDTGTAVIYRDGFTAAESRAKHTEAMFKKSERQMLKLVLKICRDLSDLDLKLSSLDIRFTRRNYENIAAKAEVLTSMLQSGKIAPELAFSHCGMFSDPNLAWQMSKAWIEEQEKKLEKQMANQKEVVMNGKGDPKPRGPGNNKPDTEPGA